MSQDISRSVIRDAMLESLRRGPPGQFLGFKRKTAQVLAERGFPVADGHIGDYELRHRDERRFRELLWSLINSGVLVQGADAANANWPFLSLTEMGEEFIKTQSFDVYDPDGYLVKLSVGRALDPVERRFAGQAIGALNANLPDAAAVMIGAAGEHLIRLLCDAIGSADPSMASKVVKLDSQPASQSLSFATRYLEDRKGSLDRSIKVQLPTTFAGVAAMVRVSRNDAGHPSLGVVDYDHALVLLRLFPLFRNLTYEIIDALPL